MWCGIWSDGWAKGHFWGMKTLPLTWLCLRTLFDFIFLKVSCWWSSLYGLGRMRHAQFWRGGQEMWGICKAKGSEGGTGGDVWVLALTEQRWAWEHEQKEKGHLQASGTFDCWCIWVQLVWKICLCAIWNDRLDQGFVDPLEELVKPFIGINTSSLKNGKWGNFNTQLLGGPRIWGLCNWV